MRVVGATNVDLIAAVAINDWGHQRMRGALGAAQKAISLLDMGGQTKYLPRSEIPHNSSPMPSSSSM